MKHSVVIPLYNKRDYVADAIASLARQDKKPDEIIIVDDASSDDSPRHAQQALAEHARALSGTRIELIRLDRNRGPGHARNTGLERATGELISFLDADDRYRPDALARIDDNMDEQGLDLAILGYASDPEGEYFPDLHALADELIAVAEDVFLVAAPLHAVGCPEFVLGRASNVVVRRSWLAVQRYHATSRLNEGLDFWYRVLKDIVSHPAGRVGLIAAPLIRFRIVGDSLSHRACSDWRQLDVPPTIERYADSRDRDDRRLSEMLGRRWLEHALTSLPDHEQRSAFVEHHRPLLSRLGIRPPRQHAAPVA